MRSFIKSHRKNDSNHSDSFESSISDYQQPPSLPSTTSSTSSPAPGGSASASTSTNDQSITSTTPNPSPRLHQSSQFTLTPPNMSTNSPSSLSSPKKLLSPIKNLFSSGSNHHYSHSKHYHSSTTVNNYGASPSSGTSLNNILHSSSGTLEKLKNKKLRHTRSHTSISNITELTSSSNELHPKYTASKSSSSKPTAQSTTVGSLAPPPLIFNSTSSPALVNQYSKSGTPITVGSSPSQTSLNSYHSASSHLASSLSAAAPPTLPPIQSNASSTLSRDQANSSSTASSSLYQNNNSIISLTQSLNNFERKQVSFDPNKKTASSSTFLSNNLPIDSDTTQVESTNETQLDDHVNDLDFKKVRVMGSSPITEKLLAHKEEEDDDAGTSSDNSSSSQFSFVRDLKGGRNTSVKYYKSKDSPSLADHFSKINTFSEHDLGYEVDEYSDYDFENNGMDDDDGDDSVGQFDEDDGEDQVQYNKVFDEDEDEDHYGDFDTGNAVSTVEPNQLSRSNSVIRSTKPLETPSEGYEQDDLMDYEDEDDYDNYDDNDNPEDGNEEEEFIAYNKAVDIDEPTFNTDQRMTTPQPLNQSHHFHLSPLQTNQKPFNSSYHLSISGIDFSEEIETLTNDHDPVGSGDDILENYLDVMTKSSSSIEKNNTIRKTPELKSADNLELFDISSPIINGLTIGHNLTHKLMRPGSNHSSKKSHQALINRSMNKGYDDDYDEANLSQKRSKADYSTNEIYKSRSFHQSISEDLDLKIKQKIANMESFGNDRDRFNHRQNPTTEVGLGIETTSPTTEVISGKDSVNNSSIRKSISSMMDLLSSLESSQTVASGNDIASKDTDPNTSTGTDQRKSIVGMMSLLANLEKNQQDVENNNKSTDLEKEQVKENRKSINDMMSTLAKLEQSDMDENFTVKNRRDSISHMMNTLAKLDVSNSAAQSTKVSGRRTISTPINSSKRYSWFNNDEDVSINKSGISGTSSKDDSGHNWDQDMLDEINQLPEDFEFQDLDYKRKLLNKVQDTTGFLRSNSYNKKPSKVVMDSKFQTNKIETLNKTVTFYRNSSLGLELGRSRSVSRAASTRSMNSFASVNEEDSFDEEEDDSAKHHRLVSDSSTLPYDKADVSTVTSNTNLTTITEAETPYLK